MWGKRVSWKRQHFRRNCEDEEVSPTGRNSSGESFQVEEWAGTKTHSGVRGPATTPDGLLIHG